MPGQSEPVDPRGEWQGVDEPNGAEWKLEVEPDVIKLREPHVVTVYIEDTDWSGMACLTSKEAREVAAVLLASADSVDAYNAQP